jgi:hypothetical protein
MAREVHEGGMWEFMKEGRKSSEAGIAWKDRSTPPGLHDDQPMFASRFTALDKRDSRHATLAAKAGGSRD